MLLNEYAESQRALAITKAKIIEELTLLLGEAENISFVREMPRFSFIKAINFAAINNWSVQDKLDLVQNGDLANFRLVLERSGNIIATLNNIAVYGNISNKLKNNYSFFRRVKPEWIVIIKNYLQNHMSANIADAEKRNISPKRK